MDNKQQKYRSIDSLYFDFDIEVNFIKRIEFAAVPTDTGENGSEIVMYFKVRYYEKYDIFKFDKSRQQCMVV